MSSLKGNETKTRNADWGIFIEIIPIFALLTFQIFWGHPLLKLADHDLTFPFGK